MSSLLINFMVESKYSTEGTKYLAKGDKEMKRKNRALKCNSWILYEDIFQWRREKGHR